MAGNPARFDEIVNRSSRYNSTGFWVPLLSNLKAVFGEVGVINKSTELNARSKSFLINLLTCCAFL